MDPREFVERRTRRYMAQALEEFEELVENPLRELQARGTLVAIDVGPVICNIERVKSTFRKKIQTLASDCVDLMPSDMQINAFEPVRSSR